MKLKVYKTVTRPSLYLTLTLAYRNQQEVTHFSDNFLISRRGCNVEYRAGVLGSD